MRRTPLFLALLLLSPAVACKSAPDITEVQVQTGVLDTGGTLYGNFFSHVEMLRPPLEALVAESDNYLEDGDGECFRIDDLTMCDVAGLCIDGKDPTGIASATHAQLMDGITTEYESALMELDWTTVFNAYNRRNEWFVQYDADNPETDPDVIKMLPIIPTLGINFAF